MSYINPNNIAPFTAGQRLSASKLEAIRQSVLGPTRYDITQGETSPHGVSFDSNTAEDLDIHNCINENALTIPSFSMFTIKEDTVLSSGEMSFPYISADIENPGLIYFTNGNRVVPQNTPFTGRNITSTYPARIRYLNTDVPEVGKECGPTNDGTGKVRKAGNGFVCLQPPDTANEMCFIQELGGSGIGASWIGTINQQSVPTCGLTPFTAYELNSVDSGDPTGYCGIENGYTLPEQVINMTGITLFEGALYEATLRKGFKHPTIFPHQIIQCLEEQLGPTIP